MEQPPALNPVLTEMFRERRAVDASGSTREIRDEISREHAIVLFNTVLKHRPRLVVEVGMAFGASSLAILSALSVLGENGRLISIDPCQSSDYGKAGLVNVQRAGFSGSHELHEAPSYLALPRLLERGSEADLVYIDGWHTFDYALVDFFFADKLLRPGGVVGFNDCGWRAVHRVMNFVRKHRRYEELDVGLSPSFRGQNVIVTALRRLEGRSGADRYFRKQENWEPNWNFYRRF